MIRKGFPLLHTFSEKNPRSLRCHYPVCPCPCEPVYDFKLREFKNGTLHVYRYCKSCGATSQAAVPRTSIRLAKWRQLLTEIGEEVRPL